MNNNTIPAGGIPPQQRPPSSEGETTTTSTTTPWTPTTSWSSTNNQRGGHEVTPIPGTAHLCFKLFNEGFRYPDDILRNQQTVSLNALKQHVDSFHQSRNNSNTFLVRQHQSHVASGE